MAGSIVAAVVSLVKVVQVSATMSLKGLGTRSDRIRGRPWRSLEATHFTKSGSWVFVWRVASAICGGNHGVPIASDRDGGAISSRR